MSNYWRIKGVVLSEIFIKIELTNPNFLIELGIREQHSYLKFVFTPTSHRVFENLIICDIPNLFIQQNKTCYDNVLKKLRSHSKQGLNFSGFVECELLLSGMLIWQVIYLLTKWNAINLCLITSVEGFSYHYSHKNKTRPSIQNIWLPWL